MATDMTTDDRTNDDLSLADFCRAVVALAPEYSVPDHLWTLLVEDRVSSYYHRGDTVNDAVLGLRYSSACRKADRNV